LEKLGAVHWQQLTGYVYLHDDLFEYQEEMTFHAGHIYKVGFKANAKNGWLNTFRISRMRLVMICPESS
jgi:hypothetical protein